MRGSVKVRLVAALERAGLRNKVSEIGYLVARYVCRLVGSADYRNEVEGLLDSYEVLQDELLELKEDLDHSTAKNNLFRSIHQLSKLVKIKENHIVTVARQYSVDCEDLHFLFWSLKDKELDLICSQELCEHHYDESDVLEILHQLDRLIRSIAHRKLGFILTHDPAVEHVSDLIGPLHVSALRVLREYEVQTITGDHLVATVARGVKNYAANLAASFGRVKRRKVGRVHEKRPLRHAFHLDVDTGLVREVILLPDLDYRFAHNGSILIAVCDVKTDDWFVAHMKRIYVSYDEAVEAYKLHQEGKRSKRKFFIDPSPQQIDDFQTTVLSIEYMDDKTESTNLFYETYEGEDRIAVDDEIRKRNILGKLGPKCTQFAEFIFNSAVDDLFDAWCMENGYDVAACTVPQFGRMVCKYMNITRADLKEELLESPASLWHDGQKQLIASGANARTEN